jgi:hypothetical protein
MPPSAPPRGSPLLVTVVRELTAKLVTVLGR